MAEELKDFTRKVSAAGRFQFVARVGKHDDLVLATAIALWAIVGRPKPPTAAFAPIDPRVTERTHDERRNRNHPGANYKNERLRTAAAECLEIGERFRERKAGIERGDTHTKKGRQQAMVQALAKKFAPALRRAQQPVARALDETRRRRAALAIPAPDPTNQVCT